jgi:hypothetical protein
MRPAIASCLIAVFVSIPAWAAGPINLTDYFAEPMDGVNTFPVARCYVTEAAHSSPVGCSGAESDLWWESAAFHYFINAAPYADVPLEGGKCMDIRRFWVSWDASTFYLGVEGPNELWERGDLFIAIDTDNATGGGVTLVAPWAKAVDFCGWDPEFFIAVESPVSTGGYAVLLNQGGGLVKQFTNGVDAANSPGWVPCEAGGMYYEFAIAFAEIGLGPGDRPRQVNFALYTTYEDDGFDVYDTGPGCGQPSSWEELGDYPYDADHCGGNLDCVTGAGDICGAAESDDNNGAGIATSGRFPGSDNTGFDRDTIGEYYGITNFGTLFAVPVLPETWGRVKAVFAR